MNGKREAEIYLAQPRGFCAGVRRAISIVEETLTRFGAPIYVRHEIVHNKHVINALKQKGVIFIDDFAEIEDKKRPVVFSAHGVSKKTEEEAAALGLQTIDATCPLVAKVHRHIQRLEADEREIIVIGKPNHVEIIGTVGQARNLEKIHVINSKAEAERLVLPTEARVGFVTQTTLSVDDTLEITEYLKKKYPSIESMKKNDICFATTNRQKAVKEIAGKVEVVLVIGSKNSSNSKQLKETALKAGVPQAFLIDDASELDWKLLESAKKIGITAGASAPEYLIEYLLYQLRRRYDKIKIIDAIVEQEKVDFKL